eukprot:c10630_g1_i2.p1 GENE.c10630_g1_i2~~c10630_g1_i2.p1  ORF type:complete len:355 (+),score=97.00 c10630_g1_i2:99-1163(+)
MGKGKKRHATPVVTKKDVSHKKQKKTHDETNPVEEPKANIPTGDKVLPWLIAPVKLESFMQKHWENEPLHVRSSTRLAEDNKPIFPPFKFAEDATVPKSANAPTSNHRFSNIFNRAILNDAIQKHPLYFGKHMNVAKYVGGAKRSLTPGEERISPDTLWPMYDDGATLQVLQPQQYCDALWPLIEGMEKFFGCLVGCNAYITPPNSQGLAPHHDDVEVFIMQVEGQKRWRLHPPIGVDLPREYSKDLTQDEAGTPMLTITMEEGDFMYFPRGIVHQALTSGAHHSTHLTISTYQHTSWFDFLSTSLTNGLTAAFEKDRRFREGLPVNFSSFMGSAHKETPAAHVTKKQAKFKSK